MQTNSTTSHTATPAPLPSWPRCRHCCDTGIVLDRGDRRYCRCEAGRRLYADRCKDEANGR